MSIHSRLCRIYDFLWIYWGWLWGNERNIIEINITDNGDIQQGEAEYFSALLKKNLGKIKKGRIYPVSDQPNVYVKANRSFIRFVDPDDDSRYIYQSLDEELGSGWHGRVKRSSIEFRLTSDDACVITMVDGPSKVIKKQRARSPWGFFGKTANEIDHEAKCNYHIFSRPGSSSLATVVEKTHYRFSSYFGYTLMPELNGIPLDKYLSRHNPVPLDKRFIIIRNILAELKRLVDEKTVAHCDLKPANIMVNEDENLKAEVFDFFTATPINGIPPLPWAAPGFRRHAPYNSTVTTTFDIYSFGIMVQDLLPSGIRSLQVDGVSLMQKMDAMLKANPDERPSIDDLIIFFESAHGQLRAHFIARVQEYITARESEAQYKHSFFRFFENKFLQYDKETKLEAARVLLEALRNRDGDGLAQLRLTPEQHKTIRQGRLGAIFSDVEISGFLNVQITAVSVPIIEPV